jgi:hypothetical protein
MPGLGDIGDFCERPLCADCVEKVENIAATKFAQKRADRRIRLAMSLKASAKATG